MFSDTLALTVEGSPVLLHKVNQDKYSSEYVNLGYAVEYRMFIRNTNYVAKDRGGVIVDRHNVEFITTWLPTDEAPRKVFKVFFVFEMERRVNADLNAGALVQALFTAFCAEDVTVASDAIESGEGINKLIGLES